MSQWEQEYGSLSGAGIDEHNKVEVNLDPQGRGVSASMQCQFCGTPTGMLIGWEELVYCMNGAQHQEWGYDPQNGAFYPKTVPRRMCRRAVEPRFTPDECGRYVRSGIHARMLPEQQVAALSQSIQQRMGQMRR